MISYHFNTIIKLIIKYVWCMIQYNTIKHSPQKIDLKLQVEEFLSININIFYYTAVRFVKIQPYLFRIHKIGLYDCNKITLRVSKHIYLQNLYLQNLIIVFHLTRALIFL